MFEWPCDGKKEKESGRTGCGHVKKTMHRPLTRAERPHWDCWCWSLRRSDCLYRSYVGQYARSYGSGCQKRVRFQVRRWTSRRVTCRHSQWKSEARATPIRISSIPQERIPTTATSTRRRRGRSSFNKIAHSLLRSVSHLADPYLLAHYFFFGQTRGSTSVSQNATASYASRMSLSRNWR